MPKHEELTKYFSDSWLKSRINGLEQYQYSGWALVNKVKPGESVLDVGCGTNPFKGKIDNLYGIDITDVGCDEQVSIEDFNTDKKFDVIFALGSVNFGDIQQIKSQISAMVKLLTPSGRIYWRCNPGLQDHENEEVINIEFFPWSLEYHRQLSEEYGFTLTEFKLEPSRHTRYYAVWTSK